MPLHGQLSTELFLLLPLSLCDSSPKENAHVTGIHPLDQNTCLAVSVWLP